MEKLILDQKTLNRIPSVFIFILILTLGLPVVAFNLFNVNFNMVSQHLGVFDNINNYLVEAQISGYFREAILQWSAFSLSATTSIGIAIFPDNDKTSQELLRKADIALYEAKNAGKNTYRIYSEPVVIKEG